MGDIPRGGCSTAPPTVDDEFGRALGDPVGGIPDAHAEVARVPQGHSRYAEGHLANTHTRGEYKI